MMNRSRWLVAVMFSMLLFPLVAMAQEVSPPATVDGPWWAQLLYAALAATISAFVVPYLARKAQAAKEEAATLRTQGLAQGLKARELLLAELKSFLLEYCANKVEKEMLALATEVLAKKLDTTAIKVRLKSWGAEAKTAAIDYFETQGLDIVELVGDKYLDEAIRWAADRVSPFPGKGTAVALATEKYSNWLVDKGVDWVRTRWLDQDAE